MAKNILLAMVMVLPVRLSAALCTAPNTPANDAMTTRVCCAPDGKPENASTSVSKPCTILRKGPWAPSPTEIIKDSIEPPRFSRSPLRLLFFAAACSAAYPLSETAFVHLLTPDSPAS